MAAKTKKPRIKRYSIHAALRAQLKSQGVSCHAIAEKVKGAHKGTALAYLYSNRNSMVDLPEELIELSGMVLVDAEELERLRKLDAACKKARPDKLPRAVRTAAAPAK